MAIEELSLANEKLFGAQRARTRIEEMSPADITRVARGLGRSTIVGRRPGGLPITKEGQIIEEIMEQNRLRNEERKEQ